MKHATRLLISIAALAFPHSLPAAEQELGRLFLTPEQRSSLDARRKARVPDRPPQAAVVESPTARIDGYAKRSGGPATLWVNGQATGVDNQQEGLRVLPRPADSSRVTVQIGESAQKFDLKIGETIDRGTGEIKDPLYGGKVVRSSPSVAVKR